MMVFLIKRIISPENYVSFNRPSNRITICILIRSSFASICVNRDKHKKAAFRYIILCLNVKNFFSLVLIKFFAKLAFHKETYFPHSIGKLDRIR